MVDIQNENNFCRMKSDIVGNRIRTLMKENRLSQRAVEKNTGVNQSVLSEVINGRRDYERVVDKLCSAYGWSRDFIITGRNYIANSNNDTSLSKEERQFLINNLHELYIRHEDLIQQAGNIMKQIAAINKILIIGIE